MFRADGLNSENLPGSRRMYKPKTPIIYQGEAPRSGFYIKSGFIKAYTLQSNGDEQIVGLYGAGDLFPLSWLFGKTSSAMYYYEVLELSQLISVTRKDITDHIINNLSAKDALLDKLISEQSVQLMRIASLEQSRAVEKILFTLYYLTSRFGKKIDEKDTYKIEMKLTHATIASLVGLTRETTATELHKIKSKGILFYQNKQYSINQKKLEAAMGEDSFSELLN